MESVSGKQEELSRQTNKHSDVYAWLTVEGTRIDYPIIQHLSDDSYYLSHDIDGQPTKYGAIFTERINNQSFDDPVTIVYGHAMRDDAMFGSLKNFSEQETFDTFRTIQVTTKEGQYTYDIFAAYTYTDEHLFYTYHLDKQGKLVQYISNVEQISQEYGGYYRKIDFISGKDKLLILSTCDLQLDGSRFVVHAIRRGG